MKRMIDKQQSGMALVAALFLIVVLAALGVMALNLNTSQQQNANLTLLGLRAQAAAQAGIEFGSNRALQLPAVCTATTQFAINQAALTGFTVIVNCVRSDNHVVNGTAYPIYNLSAFAWRGTYGSPDYASRRAIATVSRIP
jgi:MSHA biogenesis protein MshP